MRRAAGALAVLATAGALVVGAAAPALATPDPCPNAEPICLYLAGGTYALTNPVTQPPTGTGVTVLYGPSVCDSSGTTCVDTYVVVPGATVASTGATVATVTLPGLGFGIDATGHLTVYAGAPGALPTVGSLGVVGTVSYDENTVQTNIGIQECYYDPPSTFGPVTVTDQGCVNTVTVSL